MAGDYDANYETSADVSAMQVCALPCAGCHAGARVVVMLSRLHRRRRPSGREHEHARRVPWQLYGIPAAMMWVRDLRFLSTNADLGPLVLTFKIMCKDTMCAPP